MPSRGGNVPIDEPKTIYLTGKVVILPELTGKNQKENQTWGKNSTSAPSKAKKILHQNSSNSGDWGGKGCPKTRF